MRLSVLGGVGRKLFRLDLGTSACQFIPSYTASSKATPLHSYVLPFSVRFVTSEEEDSVQEILKAGPMHTLQGKQVSERVHAF